MAQDTATIHGTGGGWTPLPEPPAGLPEEGMIRLGPLREELAEIEACLAWVLPPESDSTKAKIMEWMAERIRRRIWQGVQTIEEAAPEVVADRLGVSGQTIRNWCRDGHVKHRRVGPKYVVDVRSAYDYAAAR